MKEYELREYRPGHYAKIESGKVVGKATFGEIRCYFVKQDHKDLEVGVIEISLALTAVLGVFFASNTTLFAKILASIGFLGGVLATSYLSWTYFQQRMPMFWTEYSKSSIAEWIYSWNRYSTFFIWIVFFHLPVVTFRYVFSPKKVDSRQVDIEYAYGCITSVITIAIALAMIFMFDTLFPQVLNTLP